MSSLKTILERMQEQNIALSDNDKIVIPLDDLYVELNGTRYSGRIFKKAEIIVTLQPMDDNFSESGLSYHPVIWKIKNTYETWLSNGSIAYRTEFYVVE